MTQEEEILESVIDIVRAELRKYEPLSCVGEVVGVNPLRVKVGSYTIDEDFMVVDSSCRKTVINIPTDEKYEHNHDEDEMLTDVTAVAATGGPVTFAPANAAIIEQTVYEYDDDGNVIGSHTEYSLAGGGSVLTLKHKHSIHTALPRILVYRGLKVGDKVNVLRIGSVHIIRGRVGVLTNDGTLEDDGSEQL